jgi:hypothetical protein
MPRRETDEHRAREQAAAERLGRWLKLTPHKLEELDRLDWYFTDEQGTIDFIGEIKCRTHRSTTFDTLFISCRKIAAMKNMRLFGMDPFFAAVFADDVMRVISLDKLLTLKLRAQRDGRTDRDDAPNDLEPMVLVPLDAMREVPL